MIIFYNKITGQIYSTINGRAHDEHTLNSVKIKPSDVAEEEIGKFVVPYETIFVRKEEPHFEMIADPENPSRLVRTEIGTDITEVPGGMKISGPMAEILSMFEDGTEDIYQYKVELNENQEIIGFIKLPPQETVIPEKTTPRAEKQELTKLAELTDTVNKMKQTVDDLATFVKNQIPQI